MAAVIALVCSLGTWAFPVDVYTPSSRLAQGQWVKVSVPSSGMYAIPASTLKSWGFSDPSRVRVYGYGGQRISDVLSLSNYIDDLPMTPSTFTAKQGLVFYGEGPETWTRSSGGSFVHTLNPFTTAGYYFIGEAAEDDGDAAPAMAGAAGASEPVTQFIDYLVHEKELTKLGETGHLIVGEDFKWSKSQSFPFTLADVVTTEPVRMTCAFVARNITAKSTLKFTANGVNLSHSASDDIRSSANAGHSHGEMTTTSKTINVTDSKLNLGITFSSTGVLKAAHLDYIEINYVRQLKMPQSGQLRFDLSSTQARLAGGSADTHIWDVTDPLCIYEMRAQQSADGLTWTNDYTGNRRYVAWSESASLPMPGYVGAVGNQNLHGDLSTPDMVIITLPELASEAERIAQLHRNDEDDPLEVLVITPDPIYNEFGSGSPDVNTFRRYLKMLYDRGEAAGRPLKYALFMGSPRYDNRCISAQSSLIKYPTLPTWQSDTSLDDNISFTTDDIFAFLRDGSGASMGSDYLCIAVGRIPARTAAEAKVAVDKLYEYTFQSRRGTWRNQVLFLADDGNSGIHMEQSEETWNGMLSGSDGDQFIYTKVYIDAFEASGGTYPDARNRMYNRLDEGLLWWNYIGHANPTSWTGEKMLTYKDICNLYIKSYPILYAATCQFLNWDSADASGAEIMYFTRQGGIIAAITAVRPVYISENGLLGRCFAPKVFERDEQGRFYTLGEVYRRGKNNIVDASGRIINNTNKLRYVLMGDPAMRYATPENRVRIDRINGEEVTPEAQVTIMANQLVTLEGSITGADGNVLTDFNGDVTIEMYDAEYSTVSNGYGIDGKRVAFDEIGSKLYHGRDSVAAGRFIMQVAMPEAVAHNFRPATLNMYASSDAGAANDAIGVCRDFYVYGLDDKSEIDTVAPVIRAAYLNHPSWVNGGVVNPSPVLIAEVSDNLGFNLSTTSVGHSMSIQLDGGKTLYNDVALFFKPDMGSRSGTVTYTINDLMPGNHQLRFRVWDTFGNMAEEFIDFVVMEGAEPDVYKVWTDASPASIEANFYLSHNRPNSMMTVQVEVFNLLGQPVWSATSTGISDMYTSVPVTWDLTDQAGHRVKRGIYLYRATITESDGAQHVTATSKLAVTAP